MSNKTFDLKQPPISITELLYSIQNEQEIVITNDNISVAKLTLLNPVAETRLPLEKTPQPGLNLGAMVMIDDFYQPLPDEFWLQNR
ncbi:MULTISPECIES: toxin-antitoxin (TA) system antitoxin [unclassified Okeania]|uniref:toxin-antitoxin (TA) system antitoxin n=1 Tax=unclassified Okeania TaxID=2634635 RepID=UPI0013BDE125|nr:MULTISPECIES: toxin-antitoxin (TA) system antitoxin [unclassified Okeania]NET15351.1 prevent-host-death protein [Okeania sp. SIO1H6]NES77297.1 prevent-host-death protein [Okeania sp. SIO1H4]NET18131.1 prevent-host-death protein [Okeania sp. SIO1H5]NET76254.1 prevent-host-death protein [Okeania sp. SIO1F9]NET93971.1 prevent-host-death protein [Okeania sp. SIO1H2]